MNVAPPIQLPAAQRTALRRSLLTWYRRVARDLPWRRTDDPYRILLSELLLQQTRVEAARPYYERFVAAFPTVRDLAAAPLEQVLTLWAGLGYYRRARNLHRAAAEIVERFDGHVPDNVADLRSLPGVGRYTAAAVASIAFNRPAAALDGNIKRVLARLAALETPIDQRDTEQALWTLAEDLLARRSPGAFNQALMELGATLCAPRNPACLACPLRRWCRAATEGIAERLPVRTPKRARPHVEAVAAAIERRGRLLLVRRPERGLLAGMWELPGGPLEPAEPPEAGIVRIGGQSFGATLEPGECRGTVEHVFTHRTTRITVLACTLHGDFDPRTHPAWAWHRRTSLDDLPLATLDRKVLALL